MTETLGAYQPAADARASTSSTHHFALPAILEFEDDNVPDQVEHFNYKQELNRKLTVTSIIGLSFALMDVPFGVSSTIHISVINGGSVTMLYGWVVVSVFSLFVCLSLAEISSKFPTSGGIYHFSALLASPRYSLAASWFSGWFLLLGMWTLTVSYIFCGAQFVLSILGMGSEVYHKKNPLITLLVYYVVVIVCGIVNLKLSRKLDFISKACIHWTIYTVLIIDVLLLVFSTSFNDLMHILTNFDNSLSGGYHPVLSFLIGLQPASFTLQGYGMIPAMAEEVENPKSDIPRGLVYAVIIAGITGLIFIIPILAILPELTVLQKSSPNDLYPIDLIFKLSTKSLLISIMFVVLLVGTSLFAGIGCITTASRCTYAFARDNGLPFQEYWVHVAKDNGILRSGEGTEPTPDEATVPKNAIYLSMAVPIVFGLLSLISSSAFNAFMGSAVISLSIANGIPILALVINKRKKVKGAPFRLKSILGFFVNYMSLCWIVLSFFVLCMPTRLPITGRSMNYSIVVIVVMFVCILISYYVWGKKNFHGPLMDNADQYYIELDTLGSDTTGNANGTSLEASMPKRQSKNSPNPADFDLGNPPSPTDFDLGEGGSTMDEHDLPPYEPEETLRS
ncbi:hypothetical protein BABINDRAFT_158990 [Babjeviella inositovora NRRL Y-12698]|uniref:Amino acid permease/ SLC12A domain-containing protein n=1 Tax=Babjeviella inositovora NRRL Y-12698 TaxID=984486 RepID=A0A1E3QXV9_9ASCO|nr:uncharacterized protein BABINDRAFT_158990 [Babjeviella inositovora NRRL Y-12698]ODQ82384.1 hypothetical protein BABINDRAFT_158990 [Babjeviella inositovora NRRL Y-12698]